MKAKLALGTLSGTRTLAELASKYKVHPSQICNWKQALLENAPNLFDKAKKKETDHQADVAELHRVIGKLKAENDFLSHLPALHAVGKGQEHLKKVTPPEEATTWLPLVHMMIGNMKKFINGTFHGVSSHALQEYPDEFCSRFHRRFWEPELPWRLLNAALAHGPVKFTGFH